MRWTIREERAGDASAIAALTEAAFRDAPHRSGTESATITVCPSWKPSLSRSGSSPMIPPTVSVAVPSVKLSPGATPSRSAAPSASQAWPAGGAPASVPSASVKVP